MDIDRCHRIRPVYIYVNFCKPARPIYLYTPLQTSPLSVLCRACIVCAEVRRSTIHPLWERVLYTDTPIPCASICRIQWLSTGIKNSSTLSFFTENSRLLLYSKFKSLRNPVKRFVLYQIFWYPFCIRLFRLCISIEIQNIEMDD